MSIASEFKRRGKNIERNIPLNPQTASVTLLFSACAAPFSTELAVGILASPTILHGVSGGLQVIGKLLERNEP